jgi:hypothetical protein
MLSVLPNEILLNIFSNLDLDQELRMIKLYNLPKKIPKKLSANKIDDIYNLLKRKFEIDHVLKYVFSSPYYIDLTYTFNSKYKRVLISYINSYNSIKR